MGYGYTRTREASAESTILLVVCVASRLVVNGVAGSILYASGVPAAYSYQYSYPYALAYSSYTQPSLVLANHLLPLLDVNYDISSPLATVIQRTETPLKDASSFADDDNVEDDCDDDDDDASRGSADETKSEETPSNQSSAQPPSLLGKEESLPVIPSVFLDQTPSTALAADQPSTFPTSTPTPILTEEADKLKYYYPSLPITHYFFSTQTIGMANNISVPYAAAEGKLQTVSYVSSDDGNGEGFRVAATNLPQPSIVAVVEIPDSPEVATAKAAHLQALSEAVAMANVNRANNAAATGAGSSANPSGDNVVSGCNETSEVKR
ncbi:uncharacterized protein LOC129915068 [Episyrphus balteatus]|uniref:uncharacterized protein LOC129915068 n=1 Tax=Episyrphus balteatus TaxID=286459 RepID=UPI0024867EFE|nr:uncharacterized protein LOC129915068 [Episyrphus balteatus]